MKRTIKQPRKALATPARLGLLAAVSGFSIVSAISSLSAQSTGETAASGGFTTAGIPVGDDVFGSQAAPLRPIGVGPAAGNLSDSATSSTPAPGSTTVVRRGRWTTSVTPFIIEGDVTYSDNINLESDGNEDDETVLTATAGVTLGVQSERLVGQLSYAASYDTFSTIRTMTAFVTT